MKLLLLLFLAIPYCVAADTLLTPNLDTSRFWDLDISTLPSFTVTDEFFGSSFAAGDFNGDGTQDLAVSVPEWDYDGEVDSGVVIVMFGSATNITGFGHQLIHQLPGTSGTDKDAEANDRFGTTLVAGDFNGDGYSDLAVGSPAEDLLVSGNLIVDDAGAVDVFLGSPSGLAAESAVFLVVGSNFAVVGSDDQFGGEMVVGDFNGDNKDDLAISLVGQDVLVPIRGSEAENAGEVRVYYGSDQVFLSLVPQRFDQNTTGIAETPEADDVFGGALAAGDFDGDGFDDLAIGASGEGFSGQERAGIVHVLEGSNGGLSGLGSQIWGQNVLSIESPESFDFFGGELAAGDFNGDGEDDLAIAAAGEDFSGVDSAGIVHVIYGSQTGLNSTWHNIFSQASLMADSPEDFDFFGQSLTAGDLNYDGYDELLIGVPLEDNEASTPTAVNNGMVHMLSGSELGLGGKESQYYGLLAGASTDPDLNFGSSLVVGRFGQAPTMVVGMPGRTSGDGDADAGGMQEYIFEVVDLIFENGFD